MDELTDEGGFALLFIIEHRSSGLEWPRSESFQAIQQRCTKTQDARHHARAWALAQFDKVCQARHSITTPSQQAIHTRNQRGSGRLVVRSNFS